MEELTNVESIDSRLDNLATPLPTVSVPLNEISGRILALPIVADRNIPPFDRVMMDGYAIRFADKDCEKFHIEGTAYAGSPPAQLPSTQGKAIEVTTGCPLPDGSDCIIPYESTLREGDTFSFLPGSHAQGETFIHKKGSDFEAGASLIEKGIRLRSVEAGIIASCGISKVAVSRRPRISIFGTGDELVPVEEIPDLHQIRRSNALAIEQSLATIGIPVQSKDHIKDAAEDKESKIANAIQSNDILIISGALSKGKLDWVPSVLDKLAVKIFHGVFQKPGKPMGFWRAPNGCSIFALPGNPVSTLVATHRYIIPFILRVQGAQPQKPEKRILDKSFHFLKRLTLFMPVIKTPRSGVIPVELNNSGDYARLAETDGFVEFHRDETHWPSGTRLAFYPWL